MRGVLGGAAGSAGCCMHVRRSSAACWQPCCCGERLQVWIVQRSAQHWRRCCSRQHVGLEHWRQAGTARLVEPKGRQQQQGAQPCTTQSASCVWRAAQRLVCGAPAVARHGPVEGGRRGHQPPNVLDAASSFPLPPVSQALPTPSPLNPSPTSRWTWLAWTPLSLTTPTSRLPRRSSASRPRCAQGWGAGWLAGRAAGAGVGVGAGV